MVKSERAGRCGVAGVAALVMSACGGGGGDGNPFTPITSNGDPSSVPSDDQVPGSVGDEEEFLFDCNGITLVSGPGDTITCNGETFVVDADGQAVPSGGDAGGATSDSALSERLRTRFRTEDSFDLWFCQATGQRSFVAYRFQNESEGAFFGVTDDGTRIDGQGPFTYSVTGPDSVLLDYSAIDAQEELTGIVFDSDSRWRGFSSDEGTLSCTISNIGG